MQTGDAKVWYWSNKIKLYSLEGNTQALDGGAMFGNAPKAVWQNWLQADDNNTIELACRCLLARDLNASTVLFETGIGAFFAPKLRQRFGVTEERHVLLDSLNEVGLSHEDVDIVVLSHLHFDHAGGLLSAFEEGQDSDLLFPNAQFLVGQRQWQRATTPHSRDRASYIPRLSQLLENSGRLHLVDQDHHSLLGDEVRFHFSDGHTPGLMLAELGRDAGLVFCADLVPGTPWMHVPITMGYDRYPELLIDEKASFLEDKLSRDIRLFFTHDPELAVVGIEKSAKGKFQPSFGLSRLDGQSPNCIHPVTG